MDGSLRRVQAMTIDNEFIPLGNAAKNVCVVENQAVALRVRLLVEEKARR
jgi:hypothetical protein